MDARSAVDAQLKKVVPEFQEYAFTKAAPYRNHWVGANPLVGNYGKDFWLRTTVNFAGIWANTTDEVIYFAATRDSDEKLLSASSSRTTGARSRTKPPSAPTISPARRWPSPTSW